MAAVRINKGEAVKILYETASILLSIWTAFCLYNGAPEPAFRAAMGILLFRILANQERDRKYPP